MTPPSFGQLLRSWRTRRRYTQLALANEAEVSARHLSYMETGRSKPSREMVLVLASTLEIPLEERNRLLLSAGYAPAYRDEGLEGDDADAIRRALRFLLRNHEPYPALVVDPVWEVVMANDTFVRLERRLFGEPHVADPGRIHDAPPVKGSNTMRLLFDPQGLRSRVLNFEQVAPMLLDHLRRTGAERPRVLALLAELEGFGPLPTPRIGERPLPLVVPLVLRAPGQQRVSLFSTMTMLGTATDTVLSSLRLETYFPGDGDSEVWLRSTG